MKIFLLIFGFFVIYTQGYYYHKPAFVDLYTDDSILYPPGLPPVKGKKAIKKLVENLIKSGQWPIWRFVSLNKLEAECGDRFVTSSNAKVKGADGEIFEANSVRILRSENGVLKLSLVIWNRNSSKPTKKIEPKKRLPKFRSYPPYRYYYQHPKYPRYYVHSGYRGNNRIW